MKVVDASPWEERNLGTKVFEIVCDTKDNVSDLKDCMSNVEAPYMVVKIPSGRVDLLSVAQSYGFSLIECLISLEGDITRMELPGFYKRFIPYVKVEEPSDNIKSIVLKDIESGEIFETDRIAVDPYFSKEIAGLRYKNWVSDELSRGASLVVSYYRDEPVAFDLVKKIDENIYDALLGGLLPDKKIGGMGFLAIYAGIEQIKKLGGKKYITKVSSNNLPILKLHQAMGFAISDITYILVKHSLGVC